MKQVVSFAMIVMYTAIATAQLELTAIGSTYTIDFTGYAGEGFDLAGSEGFLDADTWAVTGFSDGDKDFGEEATTGDFARGTTMGGVATGGLYGVDILGNQGIMVQPVDDDFTPGSIRLKIWNNTGAAIGQLDIQYTVYAYNDQGRSGSFNFAHSIDNSTYTDEPTLDYTSGEAATYMPETETKSIALTGLNIPDGDFYYLKWEGDDVGGSGSRDEFALDDIIITPYAVEAMPEIQFSSIVLTTTEGDSVTSYVVISESADCSVEVSVDPTSTADASDYSFTDPLILDFTSGGSTFLSFDIITIDDAAVEPSETIVFKLDNASAGCTLVSGGDVFTLHVLDNDDTDPIAVNIADVTEEDANGVAVSIGEFVKLTGIVYGVNLADDVGLNFTMRDATGGIRVVHPAADFSYTVTEKDEIEVVGLIGQENGLTIITPQSVTLLSSGNALDTATLTSLFSEETESTLIECIGGLNYVNMDEWAGDGTTFDVQVNFGSNIITVRIDNSVDLSAMPAPHMDDPYYLNITGIGSQEDADAPFTDGYIIMPRYASDIVLDPVLALPDNGNMGITLYPNPVNRECIIQSGEYMQSVALIHTGGEMVLQQYLSGNRAELDLSRLVPGMYIAKITTESGVYSQPVIKF